MVKRKEKGLREQNAEDLKKAFKRFLKTQDKKRKRGGND